MEETDTSLLEEFVAAAEKSNPPAVQDTAENGAADNAEGNKDGESATAESTAAEDPNPEEDPSASSEENEPANEDTNAPKDKSKFSHRKFKKYEFENRELKRQLAEFREFMNQQKSQQAQEQSEANKPKKPVRSQFSSDDEYQDALAFYHATNVRAQQDQYAQAQAQEMMQRKAWANEFVEKLHDVYEGDAQGLAEWKALHEANPPMPAVLGRQLSDYIYSLEDAPKVQVYLWKHPKATQKLVSSHPFTQAEMLRNIRAFVGRKPENETATKSEAQNVVQPTPLGSARTGGAKAESVNLDNASASQIFDMILASR